MHISNTHKPLFSHPAPSPNNQTYTTSSFTPHLHHNGHHQTSHHRHQTNRPQITTPPNLPNHTLPLPRRHMWRKLDEEERGPGDGDGGCEGGEEDEAESEFHGGGGEKVPKAAYAEYLRERRERLDEPGLTGDEPIGVQW
ncbi:hypothetical protein VC83_09584 [Pseudogymnoascus destructans]|uniref:Uncharacterized protein n=1 Tax=Pseudogymnoascus destructans TaxID=655981 RepID=A0A2P6FGE8_9PEZI|nr:uncharacterized protein VC83_09584 [Pseudogymnoascus destructans]PQM43457.1 hypothetical protein VC83_09584 [Pseudogymnoascus destructans]